MHIGSVTQRLAPISIPTSNSARSQGGPASLEISPSDFPAVASEHFTRSHGKLQDIGEGAAIYLKNFAPAAALTGAAATYAYQVGGVGLAGAALVGVPLAAAGISKFAESFSIGGGPNYGGAKGLNAALIGGSGFVGGLVGAVAGAHYGSVALGAAAGALAPAALTAVAWGGLALFN